MNEAGDRVCNQDMVRRSTIPSMIGHTIAVHDGKHVPVYVTEDRLDTNSESSCNQNLQRTRKDEKKSKLDN